MEPQTIVALVLFAITYILMLSFQKFRPWIALISAFVFMMLGACDVIPGFGFKQAFGALDFNVIFMLLGMMGLVIFFIDSKMPALLADFLMSKVPNVKWAVVVLSIFAGIISAFLDNVATVLMVAPIAISICKKLNISPVAIIISIAVSSNLQGAATLVGDTTSIMLSSYANMNFLDFFWMNGKPGIFFAVELGALATVLILFIIFRKEKQKVESKIETKVEDYVPTILLLASIVTLIGVSFIPSPETTGIIQFLYDTRSGLVVVGFFIVALVYSLIKKKDTKAVIKHVWKEVDKDTILLLIGLFIIIAGITQAGLIDLVADFFYNFAGNNPFGLYTLLVFASVLISAFIDNIPYVATMLPVVAGITAKMGVDPNIFYFGLLIGSTLGGNLTPIGASANIAGIGILKKNGYEVKLKDFLKIGIPFTLTAVIVGWGFMWLTWGIW